MTRHNKSNFNQLPSPEPTPKPKGGRPTAAQVLTQQILQFLPDFHDTKLTIQEALFAIEYASNGFDGHAAYAKHFDKRLSRGKAEVRAHALLRRDEVRAAVVAVVTLWINEKKLRLEREVIHVLYCQAFYDPAMFINPDGSLAFANWKEIDPEWRVCIEGIEAKRDQKGNEYIVIKLVDRKWALDKLSRLLSIAEEGLSKLPSGTPEAAPDPRAPSLSNDTRERLRNMFSIGMNSDPVRGTAHV